jgi:hypothetical protein
MPRPRQSSSAFLFMAAVLGPGAAADSAEPAAHDGTRLSIIVVPAPAETVPGADRWTVYLDGYFDPASAARVAQVLSAHEIQRAVVYFNSPGGSLLEGMAIGRLLHDRGFDTQVGTRTADVLRPAGGVCYSACPFAYAGGLRRGLASGSSLGIHRAENRLPVPDESAFERRVHDDATAYLEEMGVSPRLYGLMAQVPPGAIRRLSRDEAVGLGLVNSPQ